MNAPPKHVVPLLDLRAQLATIRDEILAAIEKQIDTQQFILGSEVEALEKDLALYCGVPYAIGCASGTDALILALRALDIGPGDEVATTPFSFFATASSIHLVGARPVFVDINAGDFNIDPDCLRDTLARHPKIKAIMPVHLFGACSPMDSIQAEADRFGLPVIEDAAQAIGAEYNGRRAGGLGRIGCFSFFPSKNLGGYGDGGLVTTGDAVLASRFRSLRVHGSRTRYFHDEVGLNSRLDELQAAVLRVKLRHLDAWTGARQRNAAAYTRRLEAAGLPLRLPRAPEGVTRHAYNQYVVRAPRRDELRAYLAAHGIGCEIYYPLPLHRQPCFEYLGYKEGDFPVSEQCAGDVLALPVYPELPPADLEYVCETIGAFYRQHAG